MTDSVSPFQFHLPTHVTFGHGTAARLGDLCQDLGHENAFVVVDPGVHDAGVAQPALDGLARAGIRTSVWTELQANPIDTDVERAADAMKQTGQDVVIGIGGGSALDTAKGIAVLAANGGRVRDYAGNGNVPHPAWPLVLVPTTAGTGSEVTANASITNVDTHDKIAVRDPNAYARVAVLDPGLLTGLPSATAAAAGIDALTHAVESYASIRASAITRCLAREAIAGAAWALERFVNDRSDPAASSTMLYVSFQAGIAISHTGTGTAHALSRALGGRFGIAHGAGCGTALPPVMRFNAAEHPGIYAEIADALGVAQRTSTAADATAACERVDEMRHAIGLPKRLGLTADDATVKELQGWVVDNAGPNPRTTKLEDAGALLAEIL